MNNSLLLCYMMKGIELVLVPILAFIALTKPNGLVSFSGSVLGKLVLVLVVIGAASRNLVLGLIAAAIMVVILENKYEGYGNIEELKEMLMNSVEKEDSDNDENNGVEAEEETEEETQEEAEEKEVQNEKGEDKEEPFLSGVLSKIGITSSNERIDTERKLQQGKCSNQELGKM